MCKILSFFPNETFDLKPIERKSLKMYEEFGSTILCVYIQTPIGVAVCIGVKNTS